MKKALSLIILTSLISYSSFNFAASNPRITKELFGTPINIVAPPQFTAACEDKLGLWQLVNQTIREHLLTCFVPNNKWQEILEAKDEALKIPLPLLKVATNPAAKRDIDSDAFAELVKKVSESTDSTLDVFHKSDTRLCFFTSSQKSQSTKHLDNTTCLLLVKKRLILLSVDNTRSNKTFKEDIKSLMLRWLNLVDRAN